MSPRLIYVELGLLFAFTKRSDHRCNFVSGSFERWEIGDLQAHAWLARFR